MRAQILIRTILAAVPSVMLAQTTRIDAGNWGSVTAPVFGRTESGYSPAPDLFAGPNKFGAYYSGVLPNGRIVTPAGASIQVGMNPLGAALTPDGRFLVTSNDDERNNNTASLQSSAVKGGYSLSVIDTAGMQLVSQLNAAGNFFIGLQITGDGPYTVWASGGPDNDVKLFTLSTDGVLTKGAPASISIKPILPSTGGYVSNYSPDPAFNAADSAGNKLPVPTGFDRTKGAQITFPAGSALSPDGRFLYVACNGDNSVAVIDTVARKVVRQVPVGYFPYGVAVSGAGDQVFVSNWGVTEYKFWAPLYDPDTGKLIALGTPAPNEPDGFYVAPTNTVGANPKTSSISLLAAPKADGNYLTLDCSLYQGRPLDALYQVGDTHPSAMAVVRQGDTEVLYVTKSNSDSLGLILLGDNRQLPDFDLSPLSLVLRDGHAVHGAYPNALVVSADNTRLYVAEAGINSVAVLDTTDPTRPRLLGRIPTGWYPSALALSAGGQALYIVNAKGIGEDLNPNTDPSATTPRPTGLQSVSGLDSNFIFGSVQKVDLGSWQLDNSTVLANNFAVNKPADTSIVPAGGAASPKIKHVFFILHENKTFDSMLGNLGDRFGSFAGLSYNDRTGAPYTSAQYTGVSLNTQALASAFATAVNYYSDSEESDAGHQFAASGTVSDYTEKTLDVKTGRGVLVNKNFEPEDYPEGGYIFNNAARNGVSFKNYGAFLRLNGADSASTTPTSLNDSPSGNAGLPILQDDNASVTTPARFAGDVDSPTAGMGQSFFLALPLLAVLGGANPNGEPHMDHNYPGWNFNISDQRRAKEFIADFDRMVAAGTLPQFLYIYQPIDHTGSMQAANSSSIINRASGASAAQQVADGDVALGAVVSHIMSSPVYYDPKTGEGSAIFVTWDDAQATLDHIHPHRTPLLVIDPYAKPGYVAPHHYSTASVVKTEELLLGLPPNNLGDLFATDLRDLFQPAYNGITAAALNLNRAADYKPSAEGKRIWQLVAKLDTSGPDRDSARLGALARLSMDADTLHDRAARENHLRSRRYQSAQKRLYQAALKLVSEPHRDRDD